MHVIRHGESQHNVCKTFLRHYDTRLTKRGLDQAKSLRRVLNKLRPQVAVTSDILRALQTTRGIRFRAPTVVTPDARERAGWPCNGPIDSRRAIAGDLSRQFGAYDWSMVLPAAMEASEVRKSLVEESNHFDWEEKPKVMSRALNLTRYLEGRPEQNIALVSHGEFLEQLTGDDYMGNCEVRTYKLLNGEWRRLRRHACTM